jgi:hypothetical protein
MIAAVIHIAIICADYLLHAVPYIPHGRPKGGRFCVSFITDTLQTLPKALLAFDTSGGVWGGEASPRSPLFPLATAGNSGFWRIRRPSIPSGLWYLPILFFVFALAERENEER